MPKLADLCSHKHSEQFPYLSSFDRDVLQFGRKDNKEEEEVNTVSLFNLLNA